MTTGRTPSILVAIHSIDRTSTPLIRKAGQLAKRFGASLRFVHVIPLAIGSANTRPPRISEALNAEINSSAARLTALCRRNVNSGIACTVETVCGYPPGDVIARLAQKHRPAFVLAASHTHSRMARLWLSNTDWELLRRCVCPVWLSKRPTTRRTHVLAAVDPLHVHAKPSGLDDRIVQRAIEVAGTPSRVILAHCNSMPQTIVINAGVDAYWIPMPLADRKRHERMVQARLKKLADRHSIPPGNILLREGDPALDLPAMARSKGVDIVVMGAISRGALERFVIGNTAERVIDRLNCDVLVVKPRGFKARAQLEVSRRVHRASRVMPRRHAITAHA